MKQKCHPLVLRGLEPFSVCTLSKHEDDMVDEITANYVAHRCYHHMTPQPLPLCFRAVRGVKDFFAVQLLFTALLLLSDQRHLTCYKNKV